MQEEELHELIVTVIHEEEDNNIAAVEEGDLGALAIVEEEGVAAEEGPTTEIAALSLNSMAGLGSPKTFKIRGMIAEMEVIVLIDSGATHNFISDDIVRLLELPLSASASYGVVLGTGESVRASECAKV